MDKYIVTGFVKRLGRRDTISKPMSYDKAKVFIIDLKVEMKLAIPKYRWVRDLKMKRVLDK